MGNEEDLINLSLPALHWVLSKRLRYSKTWKNVEVEMKQKVFRIKWCDPKKEDPEGKETFCVLVRPRSLKSVDAEIARQMKKYLREAGLLD